MDMVLQLMCLTGTGVFKTTIFHYFFTYLFIRQLWQYYLLFKEFDTTGITIFLDFILHNPPARVYISSHPILLGNIRS